jgi:chromosome segregation ATPase
MDIKELKEKKKAAETAVCYAESQEEKIQGELARLKDRHLELEKKRVDAESECDKSRKEYGLGNIDKPAKEKANTNLQKIKTQLTSIEEDIEDKENALQEIQVETKNLEAAARQAERNLHKAIYLSMQEQIKRDVFPLIKKAYVTTLRGSEGRFLLFLEFMEDVFKEVEKEVEGDRLHRDEIAAEIDKEYQI